MKLKKFMSKFVVICLLIVESPLALAGAPEQDPTVAMVRERLFTGLIPTKIQLKPGTKWKCLAFTAEKNNFDQYYFVISFSLFDGLVQMIEWDTDGKTRWPDKDQPYGTSAINSKGLVGHMLPVKHILDQTYLVKLATNGDLLIELSITSTDAKSCSNCTQIQTPAIYDSNSFAAEYAVCPKDQILNQ